MIGVARFGLRNARPSRLHQRVLSTTAGSSTTHFGFAQVPVQEKVEHVQSVFTNVARTYDIMNDVMSFGIHRYWKDYFVHYHTNIAALARQVRRLERYEQQQPNAATLRILDVAGGTGDIAFRLLEAADCVERSKSSGLDPVSITVTDLNAAMLQVGQERARARYGDALLDSSRALSFVQDNAETLECFPTSSFDIYTAAFGLRNVTNLDAALHTAFRVLRPGGHFLCLEFSPTTIPQLQTVYDWYSFQVIPTMGQYVAQDRESYQYLVESIRQFVTPAQFEKKLQQAGFCHVRHTALSGGIVCIHEGWKPHDWQQAPV
jgi:ubiquinone/menaquinone biosynthesis methyltransferase